MRYTKYWITNNKISLFALLALLLLGCQDDNSGYSDHSGHTHHPGHTHHSVEGPLRLIGTGFGPSGTSVPEYTICPGETTPGFSWPSAPAGTQAFVLTMHAPFNTQQKIAAGVEQRPFRYWWILYNIPGSVSSLPIGGTAGGTLGTNISRGEPALGYRPPCPVDGGTDILVAFTLFALSEELQFSAPIDVTWDALQQAMDGKLLDSTTLYAIIDRVLDSIEK